MCLVTAARAAHRVTGSKCETRPCRLNGFGVALVPQSGAVSDKDLIELATLGELADLDVMVDVDARIESANLCVARPRRDVRLP
jgi:hypothetical protein